MTSGLVSRTAKSLLSAAQTNSAPRPKLLLRHASAVYTTYSPSPHTTTKRPLLLWLRLDGKISELPRSCTAAGDVSGPLNPFAHTTLQRARFRDAPP